MRNILLVGFSIILAITASAQKSVIKGRIYDSIRQEGLAYTTVSLVNAGDSTLVTFTRADSAGLFTMNAVEPGKYLLSASYVGYIPVWKTIEAINGTTNIGNVNMQDIASAGEVTVTIKRPPVTVNNDTLEFNTENFKTQPNAVVEDMLKKMPGVQIDQDGTIRVNGQVVRRVLVNGKEFFTGDVKMATQNLSADAVDKVQVFDRQSDQSQFTGIDDGNKEKTINLKLKKDKNNALFGKLNAGADNDERYDAQANVNKFKGNEQLSFLGMSNNTNRQGFQLTDVLNFTGELSRGMRSGGGGRIVIRNNDEDDNGGLPITGLGQNQQGIATTTAGGVNYSNRWNHENTDWNSSYMGSNIHLNTDKETKTQNIVPGNSFNRYQLSNAITDNTQHRVNVMLDQKFDSSFSLRITPSVTWQSTNKQRDEMYNAYDGSKKLNEGFSNTTSNADAFNFTNTILLRKKLAKKGRTISLNMTSLYNNSSMNGTILSGNKFYNDDGSTYDSGLNQVYIRDAITKNFGSTLTYTEPWGKRSLLEFSGFYNKNNGNSNKETYDYNESTGKHDTQNNLLSNDYESDYTYTGGGINYRTNQQKLNLTAGAQLQYAQLSSLNNTTQQDIRQRFTDVLPNVTAQYNLSRMKNIRFEYTASTVQPSLTQLQPVADVSDPLNIVVGNPNLKRTYQHNIQLNFIAANPAIRKNIFGFVSFSTYQNAIVRSDTVKDNGARISSYTNTSGTYDIFANIEHGFPLKKLKSRIEVGLNGTYGRSISYINAQENEILGFSLRPNISYHFSIDNKIDIDAIASVSVNNSKYSLQSFADNNYLQQNYGITMTNYLLWGLSCYNQFNYIINTGREDGFNTNVPLWNVSLAKSLLKNKRAECKLSVYDLLNKNTGITRSTSQVYITDEKYNVLRRYFLVSFTYSLNKSGLNSGPRAVIRTIN